MNNNNIFQILELPEIEKEVKRLLRADEEAYNVKWEVLREEEEKGGAGGAGEEGGPSKGSSGGRKTEAPANLDGEKSGHVV